MFCRVPKALDKGAVSGSVQAARDQRFVVSIIHFDSIKMLVIN
jgi:hypothetical protein